ncbi:hypothetical protein Tco_0718615 [Tanacetum coccineum]
MHSNIALAIVACLEIIQPGIWIFFQVGKWDLNIGGKFQVVNWREGVIMEINKMDVTSLSVNFPDQGVTSLVRSWFVRTTLTWKDGKGSNIGEKETGIYKIMQELERLEKSTKNYVADMDYLWGTAAIRVRKERETEHVLSSDDTYDNEKHRNVNLETTFLSECVGILHDYRGGVTIFANGVPADRVSVSIASLVISSDKELTGWYTGRKDEGVKMYKQFRLPIPILVYMSEVDGKFNFSPVSVNFRTEVAKVPGAFCNGVINVKDAVERQHINVAEADIRHNWVQSTVADWILKTRSLLSDGCIS